MKKLTLNQLIDGQKVLVKPYKESRFVKVGELNEMIVKFRTGNVLELHTKNNGCIYGIPQKCFNKNVNNGTWIDIFAME